MNILGMSLTLLWSSVLGPAGLWPWGSSPC